MKRLASILLVAAALGSCSKGNTDSPTPPAPSTSSVSLVPSQPIDYISKIEAYKLFRNGPSTFGRDPFYTFTFEYDDHKRLISLTADGLFGGEAGKATISYEDRTITFLDTHNQGGKDEDRLTLTPEGRVSKHETIHYWKNREGVLVQEEPRVEKDYTYDSKGRHLSHTSTEYSISSEWQEEHLAKHTYTRANRNSMPDVFTYEYTSMPNRSFPDLNLLTLLPWEYRETYAFLWSHIKGLRSSKLISSRVLPLYHNPQTSNGTGISRWTYKLDAKGRPYDIEVTYFHDAFYDRAVAYVITYLDK